MGTSYEKAFDDALSELEKLLRRRNEIDAELSRLRNVVLVLYEKAGSSKPRKEKLMELFGHLDIGTPRLTDAVKDALYAADPERRLPAIQVKDLMEIRGFDFADFTNPLASVHSTLRRLAAQGEIGSLAEKGTMTYWWKRPRWGARNSLANMLADRDLAKKMDEKIRERVNQNLAKSGIHLRP
jgi:hypothetical protein